MCGALQVMLLGNTGYMIDLEESEAGAEGLLLFPDSRYDQDGSVCSFYLSSYLMTYM